MATFNLNITGGSQPYTISVKAEGDNTERFMSYSGGIVTFQYNSSVLNYTITVSKSGCTSASQSFTLNCGSPVPIPVPIPTCNLVTNVSISGTSSPSVNTSTEYILQYTGTNISNISWSVSGGGSIISQSGNTATFNFPSSGNYTISVNYTSCGNNYTVTKLVNVVACIPISNLSISGSTTVFENSQHTYTAQYTGSSSNISSYLWTVSGSGNSVISGGSSDTVIISFGTNGGTVGLSVVSCGQTFTANQTITVNPTPVPIPIPVAPTPVPQPIPIPVPVEVPTPVAPPTPIPTPVPVPVPTPTGIVVPDCAVLLLSFADVYAYDYASNTRTFLPTINTLPSPDIAHTATKMWLYSSATITEYNITLNPFTMSFSKDITLGFTIGAGMCAIDNTTLITSSTSNHIYQVDVSGSSPVVTLLFDIPLGRVIAGDFIKTTDGKILMTTDNGMGQRFVSQYDMAGNLEFEKDIALSYPFGIFIDGGEIYINNYTDIYRLNKVSPYNLTLTKSITPTTSVEGASQLPSCCNASVTPLAPNVSLIQPNCGTSTTGKAVFTNIYNGYKWKVCNASSFICSNDCSSVDGVVSGNTFTFDSGYINGFGNQDYTIRIWSTDNTCNSYKDYSFTLNESLC